MASPNIRHIPLSGKNAAGRHAIVDADLYDQLSRHSWHCNDEGYVMRTGGVRMHHDVLGFPPQGYEMDHANGNTLDNRRENLRLATKDQQMQNRPAWGEIKYKGVCRDKGGIKASMKVGGVQVYLGPYPSDIAAAIAYDAFAHHFYGEYARLNFPSLIPLPPKTALQLRTERSRKKTPDLYANIMAKLRRRSAA